MESLAVLGRPILNKLRSLSSSSTEATEIGDVDTWEKASRDHFKELENETMNAMPGKNKQHSWERARTEEIDVGGTALDTIKYDAVSKKLSIESVMVFPSANRTVRFVNAYVKEKGAWIGQLQRPGRSTPDVEISAAASTS